MANGWRPGLPTIHSPKVSLSICYGMYPRPCFDPADATTTTRWQEVP